MKKISELISSARKHARLSQVELARKLGTRQSVISRLESGEIGNCTFLTLEKVADACGKILKIGFR